MTTPEGGFDAVRMLTDVVDFLGRTGLFDSVQAFEPDGNIGNFVAAAWPQLIEPVARLSGLPVTSVRVTFIVRLYLPLSQQTPDSIEPRMLHAAATIMQQMTAGFTIGESIYGIDLLGEQGTKLMGKAGYQRVGTPEVATLFRTYDITVPFLLTDVWTQVR